METSGTFTKSRNELSHCDLLQCFNPWQKCSNSPQGRCDLDLLEELLNQSMNFFFRTVILPYPNAQSSDFVPIIASKCHCLSTAVTTAYHPPQLLLGVRKRRGYDLVWSKPGSIALQSLFILCTSTQPPTPSKSLSPLLTTSLSQSNFDSFLPSSPPFKSLFLVMLHSLLKWLAIPNRVPFLLTRLGNLNSMGQWCLCYCQVIV